MNQNIKVMNHMEKPIIAPEMRIYDQQGKRLYLSREERVAFLEAANQESPEARLFFHVLHDTGCRQLVITQFSMSNPSTRSNSRRLLLTKVSPSLLA